MKKRYTKLKFQKNLNLNEELPESEHCSLLTNCKFEGDRRTGGNDEEVVSDIIGTLLFLLLPMNRSSSSLHRRHFTLTGL